jgi:cysteinyl-tRNA synthetase
LLNAKKTALPGATGMPEEKVTALKNAAEQARQAFRESMDDDFNTSAALAAIFELLRNLNQARSDGATEAQLLPAKQVFNELTGVLGLQLEERSGSANAADPFIDLLVSLRRDLRAEKNWALSDKLRNELKALGVVLEDSKDGTTWTWEQG